jgi:hypothetical protein
MTVPLRAFLLINLLLNESIKEHTLLEYFVGRTSPEAMVKAWINRVWKPHGWHCHSNHSLIRGFFLLSILDAEDF